MLVEDDPAQGPGTFYFGAQSVNVNYLGSSHWFSAGAFGLLIDGESTITYCVDLDQFLSLPRVYDEVMTLTNYTDAATANAIAGLWDNAFDLSLTSNTMTAAFQVVIWELITDGLASANLTNGNFWLTSPQTVFDTANAWLTNVLSGLWVGDGDDYSVIVSATGQDQMFRTGGGDEDLPEPGAILLVLLGLMTIPLIQKRSPVRA